MNRRNFIYGSAAVISAELLSSIEGAVQAPPSQPLRVNRLVGPALPPDSISCNDVVFDGELFLCLYGPQDDAPPNRQFSVAATTPAGSLLWDYPLPKGTYFRLGTHAGLVVSLGSHYVPASGNPISSPVWLVDPKSGAATISGQGDASIPLSYAGDSLFFGVTGGQGQIWGFDSTFARKAIGIAAQSFTTRIFLQEYISPNTMAVAGVDGNWIARVSIPSGKVQENPISGEFVSNVRSFYDSFFAGVLNKNGIDPTKARVARPSVILAVGGDRNESMYSLIATPKRGRYGLTSLVRFDQNGLGTFLGELQLPVGAGTGSFFAKKVIVVNSEVCVLSANGDAAWYSLPKPA